MRVTAVTLVAVLLLIAFPANVGAAGASGAGDMGRGPAAGSVGAGASPSPCVDGKYNFLGPGSRWQQPLRWAFRASSVPSSLSASGVLNVVKRSFNNITGARNDGGLADKVGATWTYLGTTTRKPNVSSSGGCGAPDGHNTVGFGALDGYYAGFTCIWWIGDEITRTPARRFH